MDKWLFTKRDAPIFCIAGIWRETTDVGEALTMLTTKTGPDIALYMTGRSSSSIGGAGLPGSIHRSPAATLRSSVSANPTSGHAPLLVDSGDAPLLDFHNPP